jgi:hypothetical protein
VETLLRDSDVVGVAVGGQRLRYWYAGGIALCELVSRRGRFCVTRTLLVSRWTANVCVTGTRVVSRCANWLRGGYAFA